MNNRDLFLKDFRGFAIGKVNDQSSIDEVFQNEVLRPILKLQNDIIIASFVDYSNKNKIDINSFSVESKLKMIENIIQKDIKFRNTLKGIIIGLFTLEEYLLYTKHETSFNKRMIAMLIERLKSQIE